MNAIRSAIAALVLVLPAVLEVAGAEPPAPDPGAHVYRTICQGCHMPQGEGATGAGFYPKLANDPTLASWQYVAVTVLNGRHAMPPFGKIPDADGDLAFMSVSLSDRQIADVVNYVRSHFGNNFQDKATEKAVAALPHPATRGGGKAG